MVVLGVRDELGRRSVMRVEVRVKNPPGARAGGQDDVMDGRGFHCARTGRSEVDCVTETRTGQDAVFFACGVRPCHPLAPHSPQLRAQLRFM